MGTALVVEDSATEREFLVKYLEQENITVLIASSGEEALRKLQENLQLDVIILDVVLPGRSGFEICRSLKAEASTSKIPIVLCSTKGTEMDKFWGLKQGADAYITKPVDRDELLGIVKSLISRKA